MKVTFIEEVEHKKAWTYKMCCSKCDDFKYTIHHQLSPETVKSWWIECENCGHTSEALPLREMVIDWWKKDETSD